PNDYIVAEFLDPLVGTSWQAARRAPVPTVGMFHHIAATFQQTNSSQVVITLYIDGQCASSGTLPGNLANTVTNSAVVIGQNLVGVVDEASVYSRVLSASEILPIYNAGASGKCWDSDGDGLPDWWEVQYFGNLTQTTNGDPDADGLSN